MKQAFQVVSLILLFVASLGLAQSPQTQSAPISAVNARYVNGVAPGYWPTSGNGLNLSLSSGTTFCQGAISQYASGSLAMAANTTNYVYLNPSANCLPAVKTTAFAVTDIPVAVVTTSGSAITVVSDVRTPFTSAPLGAASAGGSNLQMQFNNGGAIGGSLISVDSATHSIMSGVGGLNQGYTYSISAQQQYTNQQASGGGSLIAELNSFRTNTSYTGTGLLFLTDQSRGESTAEMYDEAFNSHTVGQNLYKDSSRWLLGYRRLHLHEHIHDGPWRGRAGGSGGSPRQLGISL